MPVFFDLPAPSGSSPVAARATGNRVLTPVMEVKDPIAFSFRRLRVLPKKSEDYAVIFYLFYCRMYLVPH